MGRRIQKYGLPDLSQLPLPNPLGRSRNTIQKVPAPWTGTLKTGFGRDEHTRTAKLERILELLNSRTGLPEEDKWYPRRAIGAGGFGVAALFQKEDDGGNVVDEIVIKTAKWDNSSALPWPHDYISDEARIMAQLDTIDDEPLLYLRNFRYLNYTAVARRRLMLQNESQSESTWRYYLESCPHGDLERLRMRYRAWGHYLPEMFLWHLFKGLMKAAKAMEEGGFEQLAQFGTPFPDSYLIHCDIKPENVFLGDEYQDDGMDYYIPNYPMPKVADFGLSTLTALDDRSNVPAAFSKGTKPYYAPEVRSRKFSEWFRWKVPPFTAVPLDPLMHKPQPLDARHRITPAANVWAIGMVMYQMMTLDEPFMISQIVDKITESQLDMQSGKIVDWLTTNANPEYSDQLKALILGCMMMRPEERVTPDQALEIIDSAFEEHYDDNGNNGGDGKIPPGPRVYYRKNEINELPQGPINFENSDKWWSSCFNRQELYLDESWGRLNPPNRPATLDPRRTYNQEPPKQTRRRDGAMVVPDTAIERASKRVDTRRRAAGGAGIFETNTRAETPFPGDGAVPTPPLQEMRNRGLQPTPFGFVQFAQRQQQLGELQQQPQPGLAFAERMARAGDQAMARPYQNDGQPFYPFTQGYPALAYQLDAPPQSQDPYYPVPAYAPGAPTPQPRDPYYPAQAYQPNGPNQQQQRRFQLFAPNAVQGQLNLVAQLPARRGFQIPSPPVGELYGQGEVPTGAQQQEQQIPAPFASLPPQHATVQANDHNPAWDNHIQNQARLPAPLRVGPLVDPRAGSPGDVLSDEYLKFVRDINLQ